MYLWKVDMEYESKFKCSMFGYRFNLKSFFSEFFLVFHSIYIPSLKSLDHIIIKN